MKTSRLQAQADSYTPVGGGLYVVKDPLHPRRWIVCQQGAGVSIPVTFSKKGAIAYAESLLQRSGR